MPRRSEASNRSHSIVIKHATESYAVHIAKTLGEAVQASGGLRSIGRAENAVDLSIIITNTGLAELHHASIQHLARAFNADTQPITLPDGEEFKSLQTAATLWEQLVARGLSRSSLLIAFGGGVITDLVGFVAAGYMRGIRYVSVPTSLLAQTDAALGGKTGVNLARGKNLVGSFHHPQAVLIATSLLRSLPRAEIANGYAEIIKHALLADRDFFRFLELHLPTITANNPPLPDDPLLMEILHKSCAIKAGIVTADEKERRDQHARRMLLNLGHTFAHALEANTKYKGLGHGEAVSIGMCLAARISTHLGHLRDDESKRIVDLLAVLGLPTTLPQGTNGTELVQWMLRDKKKQQQGIPLILLRGLGTAYISTPYSADALTKMMQAVAG